MKHVLDHFPDSLKSWLDAISVTALLGNLVSALPAISSLFTVLWMAIRVYETDTVQRLVKGKEIDDGR